jgi:hypothetical protein
MRDHKLLLAICLLNRVYSAEANQLFEFSPQNSCLSSGAEGSRTPYPSAVQRRIHDVVVVR